MQDNFNNTVIQQLLTPLIRTADVNATGFAGLNWRSVIHIAQFGITGDTLSGSVMVEAILEHSDLLGSAYTAVDDLAFFTGNMVTLAEGLFAVVDNAADDDAIYTIEYKGPKEFSRIRFDFTGTHTNGIETGALCVASFPRFVGRNQFSDSGSAGA